MSFTSTDNARETTAHACDPEDSRVRLSARGRVFLVGAGPGDPELLTVRAHRLITTAQIVAYDELVSDAILALLPAGAERVPVGRRRGTFPDAPAIHPVVLERALEGRDVVRLKGGDPMIFGRGGEEASALASLRIPFELVPGISAALGAASSYGIPLTHRAAASSVTFVTAHTRHELHDEGDDDLASRVPRDGTIVLYMGLSTLRATARALVAAGRAATTPVAVVSHATLATQREVVADLATIADAVQAAALEAPALVIVGEVVAHRVSPTDNGRGVASLDAARSTTPSAPRVRFPAAGELPELRRPASHVRRAVDDADPEGSRFFGARGPVPSGDDERKSGPRRAALELTIGLAKRAP